MKTAEDRLLTAEDLYDLPDDDQRQELVEGRVVSEPPDGAPHGFSVIRLGGHLERFASKAKAGAVFTNVGFILARDPDTVRGPDVAFVGKERLGPSGVTGWYISGAPDLAVEVLSPSNRTGEIRGKVAEYLEAGAKLVWVIDPASRSATTYRHLLKPLRLGPDDALDGEDVLPGFRLLLADLFEE
jgi:Uma2 family endonuclease